MGGDHLVRCKVVIEPLCGHLVGRAICCSGQRAANILARRTRRTPSHCLRNSSLGAMRRRQRTLCQLMATIRTRCSYFATRHSRSNYCHRLANTPTPSSWTRINSRFTSYQRTRVRGSIERYSNSMSKLRRHKLDSEENLREAKQKQTI